MIDGAPWGGMIPQGIVSATGHRRRKSTAEIADAMLH